MLVRRPPAHAGARPLSVLFETETGGEDFVLHPTDLSRASERAFHHALAFAIRQGAQFTLLHAVGRRATDNWVDFPSVRQQLARWRAAGTIAGLEPRVRRSSVSKIEVDIRDPVAASMQYIERNAVDTIVIATDGKGGLSRLIRPSRAERLARQAKLFTIFVPDSCKPFVDGESGAVTLRKILLPVDPGTDPRPAMLRAVRAAVLLEDPSLEITLLHVGDEEAQVVGAPELPYCRWQVLRRSGEVVEQILSVASEIDADAIYMSTTWSKSGFGRGDGNVTEGVLAGAPCPVAAVPVSAL